MTWLSDGAADGNAGMRRLWQSVAREDRSELLVALAIEQYCAAFGRHYFKNQVEDLPLQLVRITNGMHDPADLEQSIQVAGHARTCRKLFENRSGCR